ncbi:LuxR C-terminal-related transcriptional regulator [Klebsiella oxytoca]|uniref:LuxR C-terminal-related transcriptional regulator n=1 Tax=Klebsiella oxytoca TaxID=571 RepID=UPI0013259BD1|nr:LuxR C-terminal-related transcriptional regulator [Klebsiella oxytoca]MXS13770.1 LuxR family transcriptional regulator [Klebsiella oxytoca]
MVSFVEKIYLPVHIATADNYFSMGVIFLLKELFEEECHGKIIISKVNEPMAADLIVQIHSPGEKVFDWVGCDDFRMKNEYKFMMLGKKWLSVYPHSEHYDRNIVCPVVSAVITMRNSVATIRRKLFNLFFADLMCGPPDLRKPNCANCPGPYQLAWREKLMLGYLSQGLGHYAISQKMGCTIKALSSYRRSIMRKLNINKYSDFALWLGSRSVSEKYSDIVNQYEQKLNEEGVIWQTNKIANPVEGNDDKHRVLQSMKRLMMRRLHISESEGDVWLTTREIANEMDISIYSMRYLLCQMEMAGAVVSIKTGKGRSHTLRWKLAS